MIAEDPKSAEIIKPVLRGRDIRRYSARWAEQWLIATVPALRLNIDDYPAIKRYFLSFGKERLEQTGRTFPDGTKAGKRTNHAWYELQDTCAYHAVFNKEKLFWMDMSDRGRFAYSDLEMYCNDKGFMMTGKSLKYLCAVLNSTVVTWFVRNTALTTGAGLTQWKKFAVERLPIPEISIAKQRPFVRLLDGILEAKDADPEVDTTELEAEIDRLLYQLYGLTAGEVLTVEGRTLP